MSELKPCPRCGTKAYLSRDVVDGFYFGWSAGCPRYCHYDGIHGTTIDTSEEDCYAVHGANSKEEAIEIWNNRVEHLKELDQQKGCKKMSGGIGALCCITQEPHEIGEKVPVEDTWDTEQAEVVLTFTKTESIDALIGELQDVKAMMNGSYPFENVSVRQKDLDFDAFMHIENNQIYRDFMKKGRE